MEVRQEPLSRVQGGAVQASLVRSAKKQVSKGEIAGLSTQRTLSGWAGVAQQALWASSELGG